MTDETTNTAQGETPYALRISPVTVDKLGVKLYDKASAVVAELLANSYDADAELVTVKLPLATELARKNDDGEIEDKGFAIEVIDNGHGMTPAEAQEYFLDVGQDRRERPHDGKVSRDKQRAVMGRKGIGKLAPFGICRVIEVLSAGGDDTGQGHETSHFFLSYDDIMATKAGEVPLVAGPKDGTFREATGTTIRLTNFWPKRVPDLTVFKRQMSQRFALADGGFTVVVEDTRNPEDNPPFDVPPFDVPVMEGTRVDVGDRPVRGDDGEELPVTGWLGLASEAYQNEEMAGVRIYARGKIVAITRDFEQPSGFSGEYTIRSYLVGELHAEWLDRDDGDDLVRTDRQGILWDSEQGAAMRDWGATLIKEIGAASRQPRRKLVQKKFLEVSELERIAAERFSDQSVIDAAIALGEQVGSFAAEDELEDADYVENLREIILGVAPHRALMQAFQEFTAAVGVEDDLETLADLFGKTRVAEMASYGQIANERVKAIVELEETLNQDKDADEGTLQKILANAPYLIEPTWSVITQNQTLKTFKTRFEKFFKDKFDDEVDLAITWENKKPDFVLTEIGGRLRIVEIKKPGHSFDDTDFERMFRYVEAFRAFMDANPEVSDKFNGWQIDLVADGVKLNDGFKKETFAALLANNEVKRVTWTEFLDRAKTAHEMFLAARDEAAKQT